MLIVLALSVTLRHSEVVPPASATSLYAPLSKLAAEERARQRLLVSLLAVLLVELPEAPGLDPVSLDETLGDKGSEHVLLLSVLPSCLLNSGRGTEA